MCVHVHICRSQESLHTSACDQSWMLRLNTISTNFNALSMGQRTRMARYKIRLPGSQGILQLLSVSILTLGAVAQSGANMTDASVIASALQTFLAMHTVNMCNALLCPIATRNCIQEGTVLFLGSAQSAFHCSIPVIRTFYNTMTIPQTVRPC